LAGFGVNDQADEYGRRLSNTFKHQDAREHRSMREVSVKKRLVRRYILKGSEPLSGNDFQDAINQQEGIPVREDFPDPVNVDFCFHKYYFGELLTASPGKRIREEPKHDALG
jgi:hypothetical protein